MYLTYSNSLVIGKQGKPFAMPDNSSDWSPWTTGYDPLWFHRDQSLELSEMASCPCLDSKLSE